MLLKCIVCEFHSKLKRANANLSFIFTLCGSDIEVVDSRPHLGCVIRCDLDDSADIAQSHNKLVLFLDAVVKIKLL